MKKIQAIRGMNDLLPEDSTVWQYLESVVAAVLKQYGYREIRFPIVESTELFQRSIGEVTDIVEKEMYTFNDRNHESITLRPEGTASCVRACEQHGLLYNQTQKLWYSGPMFRYEKPQKGRLRQFHQIGVETFGFSGPDIDAELLMLTSRLCHQLGIADSLTLEINSLGTSQSRAAYREALVGYLTPLCSSLDEDSQRRLQSNPLRILDSKDANTQQILNDAPQLHEFLEPEAIAHFEALTLFLDQANIAYTVNQRLVRGLDYYDYTVFEWTTDKLGAQGTVCAGGRYNGLVEQLGGRPTPAIGFAMGVERLVLMLETLQLVPKDVQNNVDIYVMDVNPQNNQQLKSYSLQVAEALRTAFANGVIINNHGDGSFKSKMKKADKSGAVIALIVGKEELAEKKLTVKFLREDKPQQMLSVQEFINLYTSQQ